MQKRQSESGLVIIEKYDKFLSYIYPRLQDMPRKHGILKEKIILLVFQQAELIYRLIKTKPINKTKLYELDAGLATVRHHLRFLDFLGVRIKSAYKLLRKNSVTRAKRNIARFIRLELFDELRIFLASWIGHATKADSYNLLKLLKWELEYARFNYSTNG